MARGVYERPKKRGPYARPRERRAKALDLVGEGLTQAQVAEKMEYTRTTVRKIVKQAKAVA
jgi:DNA-binding transcriptional regulator LsrR (DeoR family)